MNTVTRLFCGSLCIAVCLQFSSCGGDPDPLPPVGAEGFYVVNEGAFNGNNASLSFYDRKTETVTNDVFQATNGRPLGDQAQSMTVWDGKGYIVVQNSGKVEVIDISDNSSIATITAGLSSPRYFVAVSSTKGYVSDWGADGVSGTVKVIDLTDFTVKNSIPTGSGPNKLLFIGSRLYVPNSGGFSKDNRVVVIDVNTNQIVKIISVQDNPNSLQMDKDGNLYVASGGNLTYNEDYSINEVTSTYGFLTKFNPSLEPISGFVFSKFTYGQLSNLEINPAHDMLYFTFEGAVYELSILSNTLPTTPFIDKSCYGLAVDPYNGDIIAAIAPSFSTAGSIEIYSSEGEIKGEHAVGIGPNGCAFK
jgi:YVTN family beta-propeller protein